jgi:Rrf2 family cysteine metabolism transcriptional repressor
MRITAKSEYACVAMLELAANHRQRQPLRIKDIADAKGMPARFLVQILLQLKTAGLVTSVRGASGGYQLTRPPDKITLAEIVNAVDDRSLTAHGALGETNHSSTVDALLEVWKEIQAQEQRLLEKVSLAELVRRSERGNALSYQI